MLTIWGAATLNFMIPRLAPGDPVQSRLVQMAQSGGYLQTGIKEMVKAYDKQFGLDQPLWLQYLRYLENTFTFNFGYSLANYPAKALNVILIALPWTIGLLLVATLIAFLLGTLAGALLAWRKSPRWLGLLFAPMLTLSSVPYYLLGLILVYVLAEVVHWFPLNGAYTTGSTPAMTPQYVWDVLYHSILPGASIVLASLGGWALTMRGMMVTTEGEDFMLFAESRGLEGSRDLHLVRDAQRDPAPVHLARAVARLHRLRSPPGRDHLRLPGRRVSCSTARSRSPTTS